MEKFSGTSLRLLEKVNMGLIYRCRYILIPVNIHFHWYLIALDTRQRQFLYLNSINTQKYKSSARTIVSYLIIIYMYLNSEEKNWHIVCICRQGSIQDFCVLASDFESMKTYTLKNAANKMVPLIAAYSFAFGQNVMLGTHLLFGKKQM